MTTLNIEHKNGYAIIQMNNGKVNAINDALAKDLGDAFNDLDKNDDVKGVILTGRPHCFSAGLDVVNLIQKDREGLKEFWRYYLRALQAMVRFSKPFVCAMTGYAPAGATIFTLCADYRIMGKGAKHVVGMHEFKMHMQIPEMMCDVYAYHLGEIKAWEYIQNMKLFNSDEAKAVGLVNESVEVDEVMARAEKKIKQLTQVHLPVYQKSKSYFRKGLLAVVDRNIETMVEVIAKDAEDPFVQQTMKFFLAGLKSKK